MKIQRLFRILGFNLLSALSFLALMASAQATAQEMPSRYKSLDNTASSPAAATTRLRSVDAPVYRVALVPSQQVMQDAAANAKGRSGEKSVSALVGISSEPPVAPYYVGPVLDSGMPATSLAWQVVAGGNVTHITVSSEGAQRTY